MILTRPATETARLAWRDVPCPLCGSDCPEVALEAADPTSREGHIFCVVRCRACDLHYTNPRPCEQSIGRFYPEGYKPHGRSGKPHRPPSRFGWFTGHDCPERRGHLGRTPGRLLDFGCGGGSYLARMHHLGWRVTGLDSSEAAVESVRRDLHLEAHTGTLPHTDLEPGSFDAITMWHSLEHVHDPLDTLRSAFRLLAPGGLLLVACPNRESLPAKWFGPDWFGLDLPRHLTHFSHRTLHDMLAVAGFRVNRIRGVKHSDWLRSSAKLAERHGRNNVLTRRFQWKPAAKLAAWLTYVTGRCDCLLALAERPGKPAAH